MLNPDNNLYSVAPVGNVVIIGRNVALKSGITRENAINLLTWLILSTNATPEEIGRAIAAALKPTTKINPTVTIMPKVQVPLAGQNVQAFIGTIDPEEQAALDEVKTACAQAEVFASTATETVPIVPQTEMSTVPIVPNPPKTAAPVPYTPARPIATPIVPPVAVATQPQTIPVKTIVDENKLAEAWGVKS